MASMGGGSALSGPGKTKSVVLTFCWLWLEKTLMKDQTKERTRLDLMGKRTEAHGQPNRATKILPSS